MNRDMSIVSRFNPATMLCEVLSRNTALFAEAEWGWSTDGDLAYIFPSHKAAAEAAKLHPFPNGHGGEGHGWALVLGLEEKQRRLPAEYPGGPVPRPPADGKPAPARLPVPPDRVFAELERRGLA